MQEHEYNVRRTQCHRDDKEDKQRGSKGIRASRCAHTEKLAIPELYSRLRSRFGFLGWWPGDTPDEIIIGAILTQRASWKNVEKAISNLRNAGMLSLAKIRTASLKDLQKLIMPSGFYRQKAKRLKSFSNHVFSGHGSLGEMLKMQLPDLRSDLLSMDGIGNETADSILLYAARRKVFVVDAYTKRIMSRIYGLEEGIDYGKLQEYISSRIGSSLELYQDFHAQFVELGKNYCKTKPLCNGCPVKLYCLHCKYSTAD